MGEIAAAGLDVLKEEPMSKENPLGKDQRQQQTVDHTTYRMGKCGSKNPVNEDHRGADKRIFRFVEFILNR